MKFKKFFLSHEFAWYTACFCGLFVYADIYLLSALHGSTKVLIDLNSKGEFWIEVVLFGLLALAWIRSGVQAMKNVTKTVE